MKTRLLTLLLFLYATAISAQPTTLSKLASTAAKDPRNFQQYQDLLLAYIVLGERGTEVVLDAADAARRDVETSGAGDAGTTLAERPGFADLLSLAIERGAVTRSSSNGSLSLATTPYAIYVAFSGSDTPADWAKYAKLRQLSFSATFAGEDIDSEEDFETFSSGEVKWNIFGNRSARDPELVAQLLPDVRVLFNQGDAAFDATCGTLFTPRQDEFLAAITAISEQITRGDRTFTEGEVLAIVADAANGITLSESEHALGVQCAEAMTKQSAAVVAAGELLTERIETYLNETKPRALSISASIHRDAATSDYGQVKLLYARNPAHRLYNFNGFVAFNSDEEKVDGTLLKRLRDYGVEAAATIGASKNMTAAFSLRRDSGTSKTIAILQAKTELTLAGAMKLPLSFSYADQATDTIEQGFHVSFGLASVLDTLVRSVAARQ